MSRMAMWKVFGAFIGLAVMAFLWVAVAVTAEWHPMVLALGCALIVVMGGAPIAIVSMDGTKRCCQRQIKQLKAEHREDLLQSRIELVEMLPALQLVADHYPWSSRQGSRFAFARWLVKQLRQESNVLEWMKLVGEGEVIQLKGIMDNVPSEERYGAETELRLMVRVTLEDARRLIGECVSQKPSADVEADTSEANESAEA